MEEDKDELMRCLAGLLHDEYCRANHIDSGCSWEHEGEDWDKLSHRTWLGKAEYITENLLLSGYVVVKDEEE